MDLNTQRASEELIVSMGMIEPRFSQADCFIAHEQQPIEIDSDYHSAFIIIITATLARLVFSSVVIWNDWKYIRHC